MKIADDIWIYHELTETMICLFDPVGPNSTLRPGPVEQQVLMANYKYNAEKPNLVSRSSLKSQDKQDVSFAKA
jgi:hypothetical protein